MTSDGSVVQHFDEDAWDDLLNYIEERRVIPIIGPDLLRVETDRRTAPALRMAGRETGRAPVGRRDGPAAAADAERRRLLLPRPARPPRRGVHAAALDHARGAARAAAGAAAARADHRFRPVRHHDVRSAARAGDEPRTLRRASRRRKWSPMRRTGSPTCPRSGASCSGRSSITCSGGSRPRPTYVVSDEDMLEFICALQSEHLTPEKLFHELEHNHLLLIGSDFSNWLARLFLRMAKRKRLSDPRDVGEVFADDHTMQGRAAGRVPAAGERAHARLLGRRGIRRGAARPLDAEAPRRLCRGGWPAAAPQRFLPPSREMPENAIFISYAREDLAAVQRLKAALDAAGLTTWFDLDRLEGGDDYDRKIQRQHRALQLLPAGHLGDDAAPARGVFPPRVELCRGSLAQHRRGRGVHPAGLHRRHARERGAGAGELQGRAHHAACRAASRRRNSSGACRTSSADAAHEPAQHRRRHRLGRDRSGESLARLVLLLGGDARLLPRSRRRGCRTRATRAAQVAHGAVRPVRPRQDVAAARRPRAAPARRRLLPGVRARGLFGRSRHRRRNRSSRRSSGPPRPPVTGRGRAPRSRASRCGSSCTTAATCCAMPPGARCCRC